MHSTLRTTVRSTACGLGVLALALTAAGCGGSGSDEKPTSEPSTSSAPASPTADSPAPSDGGSAAPAPSDAGGDETTAASERFIEFMQVLDDSDWEGACAFALDPTTGKPTEGANRTACAAGLQRQIEISMGGKLQPGMFDSLTPAQVKAAPGPDGTVTLTVMGQEFPMAMRKADDGKWYLDPSTAKG